MNVREMVIENEFAGPSYRINTVNRIAALRDRGEDLQLLAQHFLRIIAGNINSQ